MQFKLHYLLFLAFYGHFTTICDGQRTKDKMYEAIASISACFRRLNGTHQFGCSTAHDGSTGVVHFVEQPSDFDVILHSKTDLSYIPVIPVPYFTKAQYETLKASHKISGIVLYETNETLPYYSHEDTCPNRYTNLDGTCIQDWNKKGSALLLEDFHVPLFYIRQDDDVSKIKKCFQQFNNYSYETHSERSLCSLELDAFMFAAIDTPTCVRRGNTNLNLNPVRYCDSMGDQNIWATLSGAEKTNNNYIVVAARIDTSSMFHDTVPGAVNPVTSIVTLLSTARLLKQLIPSYDNKFAKNVLFLLINGETYDYIGSQRILYDMERGQFPNSEQFGLNETIAPIKLDDISLFIEINQISNSDLYLHQKQENVNVRNFITIMKKNANNVQIHEQNIGLVPPASLQTFYKSNSNLSGLLVTDHGDQFSNLFYNSIHDDVQNLKYEYLNLTESSIDIISESSIQEHIGKVADMLALSLYEEIIGQAYNGTISSDRVIIDELLHCYLENANCVIHKAIQAKQLREVPSSFYVGVADSLNTITHLIGLTLAWFLGEVVPNTNGSCHKNMTSNVYRYFNFSESITNINVTKCYRTSMNFTRAESPAFYIEDYDWSSGEYSTWSESRWREFSMQLFLKPSHAHEIMTLTVGISVFALSILTVYFMNSKSDILFQSTVTPTNC